MTQEQQDYLDKMDEMMATDGWKLLMKDLQKNIDAIKESALSLTTVEQLYTAKGRAMSLGDILGLEAYLDAVRTENASV